MSRSRESKRDYYRRVRATPEMRAKQNELERERHRRRTRQRVGQKTVVLEKIVKHCQEQAIECDSAHEEEAWLWACRWARSQLEREHAKLNGEDARVAWPTEPHA